MNGESIRSIVLSACSRKTTSAFPKHRKAISRQRCRRTSSIGCLRSTRTDSIRALSGVRCARTPRETARSVARAPYENETSKEKLLCPPLKPQLNVLHCRHFRIRRLSRRFDLRKMPGTLVIRKKCPWLTQLTHAAETAG